MNAIEKLIFLFVLFSLSSLAAQTEKTKVSVFDGIAVAGYVDQGAYINFTGPNVSYCFNDSKILIGLLPSLRIKEDKSAVKNSLITPNLGVGVTYAYKKLAVQVPFFYNSKTETQNGKWHVGFGLGYRFK